MSDIFSHFEKIVSECERMTVVEIGAAHGEDTHRLTRIMERAGKPYEYFAFEPDPRNTRVFRQRNVIKKVHLIEAAVSDRECVRKFNQSSVAGNPLCTYSGSLKKPVIHLNEFPEVRFDTVCQVRTMSLDQFKVAYSIGRVDFVWCDVQGAEDLVLAGGARFLAECRYFYTEYYDREMYEGQIPLAEIAARLPGWSLVKRWEFDALFHNPAV